MKRSFDILMLPKPSCLSNNIIASNLMQLWGIKMRFKANVRYVLTMAVKQVTAKNHSTQCNCKLPIKFSNFFQSNLLRRFWFVYAHSYTQVLLAAYMRLSFLLQMHVHKLPPFLCVWLV